VIQGASKNWGVINRLFYARSADAQFSKETGKWIGSPHCLHVADVELPYGRTTGQKKMLQLSAKQKSKFVQQMKVGNLLFVSGLL